MAGQPGDHGRLLDDPEEGSTERGSASAGEQQAVDLVLHILWQSTAVRGDDGQAGGLRLESDQAAGLTHYGWQDRDVHVVQDRG